MDSPLCSQLLQLPLYIAAKPRRHQLGHNNPVPSEIRRSEYQKEAQRKRGRHFRRSGQSDEKRRGIDLFQCFHPSIANLINPTRNYRISGLLANLQVQLYLACMVLKVNSQNLLSMSEILYFIRAT